MLLLRQRYDDALTTLVILVHRININIMHIVQGNHILHDRIHKPIMKTIQTIQTNLTIPYRVKSNLIESNLIKQQTIEENHYTRHTTYISDQYNISSYLEMNTKMVTSIAILHPMTKTKTKTAKQTVRRSHLLDP